MDGGQAAFPIGTLVVTFAVIGFGEAARAARLACRPLGVWLLITPGLLPGEPAPARWNDLLVGGARSCS